MIKEYGKTQHENTMLKLTFLSYILNPTNNYSQASPRIHKRFHKFTSASTNSQALPRIESRLQCRTIFETLTQYIAFCLVPLIMLFI